MNYAVIASAASKAVIPGRCKASNYDVQLHIGESRDSGSGASAPSRNDKILRRQYRAADQPALLQIDQRLVGLGQRHRRYRDRRDLLFADEIEQFLGLAEIADIAALDGDGLDRNQRQRPWRAAAEQADDNELAAFGQAIEPK